MTDTITKTFASPDGCDLKIHNIRGQIQVEGWDRPETEISAHPEQDWAEIEIVQEGRSVMARTKAQGQNAILGMLGAHRTPKVDYRVRVPYASTVHLANVKGSVQVTDIQGQIHSSNIDGPSSFTRLSGDLDASTVNGTLYAQHLRGTATLDSVNGATQLVASELQDITIHTVNGKIQASTTLAADGRYRFSTVNGNAHISLPASTNARVSVHGINSTVDCRLPTACLEHKIGNWKGTIGQDADPIAQITFDTVNGRLRLDTADSTAEETAAEAANAPGSEPPSVAPTAEPSETEPSDQAVYKVADGAAEPKQPRSKAQVLAMLEQGQITVDQALELLQHI